MGARTRTRTLTTVLPGGYQVVRVSDNTVIFTSSGATGVARRESTQDTTMSPPYTVDHTFVCEKRGFESVLRYAGECQYSLNGYIYRFLDYNPTNRSLYQYSPSITPVNWPYWKTKALANLNPNAPVVDIPLFLFEFKDFPRMLRNLGEVLSRRLNPRAVPEGWLAYSFGWAPLISDLYSLFNLSKSIHDRMAYLRSLEAGGRYRRSLGGGVVQHSIQADAYSFPITNRPAALVADVETLERQRVWFTANAKLTTPLPLGNAALHDLSKDIVLGLRLDPSTVWNMIPWSWLIDYFSNIGDFMLANRGGVTFSVTRMCIMCTSSRRSNLINRRHASGVHTSGGNAETLVKQRAVFANPRPQLTWDPFLSGTQILNIGALLTASALKAVKL